MVLAFAKLRVALIMPMFFVGIFAFGTAAQTDQKVPNTLFYDAGGDLISNNEFVDIRMANFNYRDETVMKVLPNGTVEFRLKKVPQEGMAAPKFSARTLEGVNLSSAELKGKVVVLNFWFIGCGVCRSIKPDLNATKAKFADRDDIIFIAVTADPSEQVQAYLKNEPFAYQQIADAQGMLDKFSFTGYPKNIVISRSGNIVYWRSSITAWDKFESVIRSELNKAVH